MTSDTPIYEHIRAELRRLLASGAYKVGDQLPTTRELSEQFGTNGVQTVRSAYEALIDEGLVVARQGKGYFVAALPLRRLGLLGLAERAREAREDAERAAGQARILEVELAAALSDHERVAVDALTAAARETISKAGGKERRRDFGEIALQVLAGVAANLGGVEQLLAGRPGSWEAGIIRNAVNAIAPDDLLPRYRTEPIRITLPIYEILSDRTDAQRLYDQAQQIVQKRIQEAEDTLPQVDSDQFVWVYDIHPDRDPTPRSPGTPEWSWEAWRESQLRYEAHTEWIPYFEAEIREGDRSKLKAVYIPKSPELGDEFDRLEEERANQIGALDVEEALEEQRIREWTAYGAALKARIEHDAALVHGLDAPLEIDATTLVDKVGDVGLYNIDGFVRDLIETAIAATHSPDQLPSTPLERLELNAKQG
ncbi:GntR family transcriptional regulator [Leifsonia sp. McL0607]|uniref:GntR family transcriptional regulator n=1 Tax=Leifsonia sp. McL0607 TaxID=3415672 RepID=UPI003CE80925